MSRQKFNRNAPCSCGSGKKYKQCCLLKKNSVAKYDSHGRMKFSAVVLKNSSLDCVNLFKKYSNRENKEVLEGKLKEYSISKERLSKMSKKQLKQLEKEEEEKCVEKLKEHSFEVLDAVKEKEKFIPSDEDFRISL